MELRGLADALKSLFPVHDFVTMGAREALPGQEEEPLPEFLSRRVTDAEAFDSPLLDPPSILRKRTIPRVAEALTRPYKLVLFLSDLEIENIGRAPHVCDIVKHAVRLHVESLDARFSAAIAREFRERVSFHLAVPMADAWLFGDPAVCEKNAVPPGRAPLLAAGRDRELFLTADLAYEVDDGAACTVLSERAGRGVRRKKAPWVVERRREHPKHYLQWLCRDPSEKSCTSWREADAGARALSKLDWKAVLSWPNEYAFLHALVDDVADALGEPTPFRPAAPMPVPTRVRPKEQRTYLRNQ